MQVQNNDIITAFFQAAQQDERLTAVHLSLYFVLYRYYLEQGNPITICRRILMVNSKIRSTATYHKCLSSLHEWGYISYKPTFHPALGSKINLNVLTVLIV